MRTRLATTAATLLLASACSTVAMKTATDDGSASDVSSTSDAGVWRSDDQGFTLMARGSFRPLSQDFEYDRATKTLAAVCRSFCSHDGGFGPVDAEIRASATLSDAQAADLELRLKALPKTSEVTCALDADSYSLIVRHGDGSTTAYADDNGGVFDYASNTCVQPPAPFHFIAYDALGSLLVYLEGLTP